MSDGYAGHVSVSRPISHMRHTDGSWVGFGQSPWLLDILWHLPLTARMRANKKNAAEMVCNRVEAVDLPSYRDLSSYLVSSLLFRMFSELIDFAQMDGRVCLKNLEADAIVAIVGGEYSSPFEVRCGGRSSHQA